MPTRTLLEKDIAGMLNLTGATQVAESGIVSKTVLQSDELRVVLFTFAEGQELTTHTSQRRALIHVIEGSCDFFFSGKWERLTAGTLLHLPPNDPHAVRAATGPFSMLLVLGR